MGGATETERIRDELGGEGGWRQIDRGVRRQEIGIRVLLPYIL
jgi:hypothetical protein